MGNFATQNSSIPSSLTFKVKNDEERRTDEELGNSLQISPSITLTNASNLKVLFYKQDKDLLTVPSNVAIDENNQFEADLSGCFKHLLWTAGANVRAKFTLDDKKTVQRVDLDLLQTKFGKKAKFADLVTNFRCNADITPVVKMLIGNMRCEHVKLCIERVHQSYMLILTGEASGKLDPLPLRFNYLSDQQSFQFSGKFQLETFYRRKLRLHALTFDGFMTTGKSIKIPGRFSILVDIEDLFLALELAPSIVNNMQELEQTLQRAKRESLFINWLSQLITFDNAENISPITLDRLAMQTDEFVNNKVIFNWFIIDLPSPHFTIRAKEFNLHNLSVYCYGEEGTENKTYLRAEMDLLDDHAQDSAIIDYALTRFKIAYDTTSPLMSLEHVPVKVGNWNLLRFMHVPKQANVLKYLVSQCSPIHVESLELTLNQLLDKKTLRTTAENMKLRLDDAEFSIPNFKGKIKGVFAIRGKEIVESNYTLQYALGDGALQITLQGSNCHGCQSTAPYKVNGVSMLMLLGMYGWTCKDKQQSEILSKRIQLDVDRIEFSLREPVVDKKKQKNSKVDDEQPPVMFVLVSAGKCVGENQSFILSMNLTLGTGSLTITTLDQQGSVVIPVEKGGK